MRKRILSLLLCVVMLFSLCPQSALAEGTDGEMAIQLVTGQKPTGGITSADQIYYGNWANKGEQTSPLKWRVLSTNGNGETYNGNPLFLLSDALLGDSSTYGGVYFQKDYYYNSNDRKYYKDATHTALMNAWQGSDAQKWCRDFSGQSGDSKEYKLSNFTTGVPTAFSTQEADAIIATTKTDAGYRSIQHGFPFGGYTGDGNAELLDVTDILSGDKVFFLSAEEAETYFPAGKDGNDDRKAIGAGYGVWWLRSPSAVIDYFSGVVNDFGVMNIHDIVDIDWAARPAFNINLNSVLFTSAAVGGKISAAPGGGSGGEAAGSISKISTTDTKEWKLTLKDGTRNSFTASLSGNSTVTPGESISIEYSGATTGHNEYVSAILTDASGNALYYGRLVNTTSDPAAAIDTTKGTVSMAIPADLAAGSYTLKVFSEQYNGDKQTDYASDFIDINLTVLYVITKQPTDQFVVEGQRAEFSVEAIGDGLTYQWYINRNDGRGWRELDGAIGTAYVTSVTDLDCDGFQYGCLIIDQYGNTLKSDVAVLHVSKVPVLPETGDSSTPMLWLAMSILSMAGILLLRKKAYSR